MERSRETVDGGTQLTAHGLTAYTIGAAIVWAGLFVAIAVVLSGSAYFGQLLPILTGAMVWFVIIVPAAASRNGRHKHPGGSRQSPAG